MDTKDGEWHQDTEDGEWHQDSTTEGTQEKTTEAIPTQIQEPNKQITTETSKTSASITTSKPRITSSTTSTAKSSQTSTINLKQAIEEEMANHEFPKYKYSGLTIVLGGIAVAICVGLAYYTQSRSTYKLFK